MTQTDFLLERHMRSSRFYCFSILISFLLLTHSLKAQETAPPVTIPKLLQSITFDGKVEDPAWGDIPALPLVMYEPVFKGEVSEKTEIRIAYDENFIYASGHFGFDDMTDLRSNSLTRDNYKSGDTFGFVIDPYNDNENALFFWINPDGTRFDAAVSNDADFSNGNAFNPNFNTFWEAKTTRDETGWYAELRIPLSSLGFQVKDEKVTMGVITYRFIAKKNERYIYPAIPPKWAIGFAKPSQMQDIIMESKEVKNPVYLTPYVLSAFNERTQLNSLNSEYLTADEFKPTVGVDLKYNINTNLSLDVTINTDFAQVEVDDQQVNLSRFSLFLPEKRQFFQERAGVFDFGFGGPNRLFHSRRIGLDNAGAPITIYGGTRLVGRVGKWDLGLIDMQTEETDASPSENFGLLRLRRQVINQNSFVGGIFTSRLGASGNYNLVYGLDGLVRVSGFDFINIKWSQTFDDEISDENKNDLGKTGHLWIDYNRRQQQGLGYGFRYSRSGIDFDPEIGFLGRRNFTQYNARTSYGWFFKDESQIRRGQANLSGNIFKSNATQDLQSAILSSSLTLSFKKGASIGISSNLRREVLETAISFLPETQVAAGDYTFVNVGANFQMAEGHLFRLQGNVSYGSFYDGTQVSINANPTWNISKHLELGGSYIFNRLEFSDRDQQFNAHIIRLRIQYAFDEKLSFNNFVQLSNVADLVGVNFRVRYNFAERNDLFIVYNSEINTDRTPLDIGFPRQPGTNSQALLIKYTHTFAF